VTGLYINELGKNPTHFQLKKPHLMGLSFINFHMGKNYP
jgi:hypothetical protein